MFEDLLYHATEHVALAIARARHRQQPVLVTVSAPMAAPTDLLALMRLAGGARHYFLWERPADNVTIAALGATVCFSAEGAERFTEIAAACDAVLQDAVTDETSRVLGAPLFTGGFAFTAEAAHDERWRGFPAGLMLLPRLLVIRRENRTTLTATCIVDAGSEATEVLRCLHADLHQMRHAACAAHEEHSSAATVTRYEAAPTLPAPIWKRAVADTVDDITHGRLDKLVLARSCTVSSNRLFDCAAILRYLRRTYPSCVLFWMGTPDGDFLGATPEPLLRRRGRSISTAAIAGSTAPGISAAAARALADALAHSQKDRVEHTIVVRAIAETLAPFCESLEIAPAPQVLRLENVQHLVTPICGRLRAAPHILELVARLHPSPAVAGHPRAVALQLLQEREALDRGWYAGPIGWMDANHDGEFAVAIRSALVRGAEAALYAGAGIVADSDPQTELDETRLKLQPMLSALLEL